MHRQQVKEETKYDSYKNTKVVIKVSNFGPWTFKHMDFVQMDGKKISPFIWQMHIWFYYFFNCPEFYRGWSWWHPRSLSCWCNVHSAYTCKITNNRVWGYFGTNSENLFTCWNRPCRQHKHKMSHLANPWMQPARSLVMRPFSTVSTQTFSNVWENLHGVETQRDTSSWFQSVRACATWQTDNKLTVSILDQVWISIQFASVLQPSGPSKDASNGVGTGGSSLQREGSD